MDANSNYFVLPQVIFTWHVAMSLSPICFAFHALPKCISSPTGRKTLHTPSKEKAWISYLLYNPPQFYCDCDNRSTAHSCYFKYMSKQALSKALSFFFFFYYPFRFLSIFPSWSGQKFIYLLFVRIFKVMLWLLYILEKQPPNMSWLLVF